jgi:4a-hydroxytetrahydrobiopterin dehydratase
MENWKEIDNALKASFTFNDFMEAFSFMTEVALHSEKQDHHPLWTNVYNKVEFSLNTHDAGDIVTEKDKRLAQTINQVYKRYQ